MSYYPILRAPGCEGWTTLSNFSPNNWEVGANEKKGIYVSCVEGDTWLTSKIGDLPANEMHTVKASDIENIIPDNSLGFLSLSTIDLSGRSAELPIENNARTTIPEWRSTLGLSSQHSTVSYQGEIIAFPSPGSLLSFCPFLQFGESIENYLLFVNLSKSPIKRKSKIEIYNTKSKEFLSTHTVETNNMTCISLDNLGFSQRDLPLVICREISGIPLFFSRTKDGVYLSLEHTHPPGSLVVHGKRFVAQKILKDNWFSRTASK